MQDPNITSAIISAVVAALVAVIGFVMQQRKLRHDVQKWEDDTRARFMAENVARRLLEREKWSMRSFSQIKRRIGGYDLDEDSLRQILVRVGAVRFYSDNKEMWGLLTRPEVAQRVDGEETH